MYGVLGCSIKTTNCIESVNALIEERCAKVDRWQNSSQRQRWLATALLEVEPRLRKIKGYRHLAKLREALKRELPDDNYTSPWGKELDVGERTEDREEEQLSEGSGLINDEPWRVSTKNGLDSLPTRTETMLRPTA